MDGYPYATPTFLFGVVDGEFEPPRRENRVLVFVVSDGHTVVAEDDGLLGIRSRVLVRPNFARLLFGGRVEIRVVVTLNGILERTILAFDEVGFPLGERVE